MPRSKTLQEFISSLTYFDTNGKGDGATFIQNKRPIAYALKWLSNTVKCHAYIKKGIFGNCIPNLKIPHKHLLTSSRVLDHKQLVWYFKKHWLCKIIKVVIDYINYLIDNW